MKYRFGLGAKSLESPLLGATFVVNSEPHRGLLKTYSWFYWKHETYGESARTRKFKGAERGKDGMAAMPPRKKHVPADACFKVSLLATTKSKMVAQRT
jgi:hypothetical protein